MCEGGGGSKTSFHPPPIFTVFQPLQLPDPYRYPAPHPTFTYFTSNRPRVKSATSNCLAPNQSETSPREAKKHLQDTKHDQRSRAKLKT